MAERAEGDSQKSTLGLEGTGQFENAGHRLASPIVEHSGQPHLDGEEPSPNDWARLFLSHGGERSYLRLGGVPSKESTTQIAPIASLTLPDEVGILDYTEGARFSGWDGAQSEVVGTDSVRVVAGKCREVVGSGSGVAKESLVIAADANGLTRDVLADGRTVEVTGGHDFTLSSGDQTISVTSGKQTLKTTAGKQDFQASGKQEITASGTQTITVNGTYGGNFSGSSTYNSKGAGIYNLNGIKNFVYSRERIFYSMFYDIEIGSTMIEISGIHQRGAVFTVDTAGLDTKTGFFSKEYNMSRREYCVGRFYTGNAKGKSVDSVSWYETFAHIFF